MKSPSFDLHEFLNIIFLPIEHLNSFQISIMWACILIFTNGTIFLVFSFIAFLVEKFHLNKLNKIKSSL